MSRRTTSGTATLALVLLLGCGNGVTPSPAASGGSEGSGDAGQGIAGDGTAGDGAAGRGTAGASGETVADFSFFVTSWAGLKRLAGNTQGFGGNLTYDGHVGIEGADEICATLAESSLVGAGNKDWRAFLSTTSEDAIDRIGSGPWYDRLGRLVASDRDGLLQDRPEGDPGVAVDLPNEDGVPNSSPDGEPLNNHDTVTGSDADGRLHVDPTVGSGYSTCDDWTSAEPGLEPPAVGHSWPAASGTNWAFVGRHAAGCVALVSLAVGSDACEGMGIGCGGGYGGFYCFALER